MWDDEKFWGLSERGKLVFVYLLTNKHCNCIGFYVLRYGYAVADMNTKEAGFDEAFKELIEREFILWDKANSLLLIKNFLKHNPIYTPKQAAGAEGNLLSLPRSNLIHEFLGLVEDPSISSCGNNALLLDVVQRAIDKLNAEPARPLLPPEGKEKDGQSPRPPERPDPKKEEIEALLAHWNEICGEKLPKVQTLTRRREGFVRARLQEHTLDEWPKIFARIAKSGFLTGENDKGWRADFDWVMNQNNLVKIMEGRYDNRSGGKRASAEPRGMDALRKMADESAAKNQTGESPNDRGNLPEGNGDDNFDF